MQGNMSRPISPIAPTSLLTIATITGNVFYTIINRSEHPWVANLSLNYIGRVIILFYWYVMYKGKQGIEKCRIIIHLAIHNNYCQNGWNLVINPKAPIS
jgi:hypothetical protein